MILLGSNLRKKLLAYTFTHPDEDYYVREIAGLIDEDAGNLSRELNKLEKEGLYRFTTRGRLKLYALNKEYPLFRELKAIIFKTEGVAGSLKELVGRYRGISLAFIHGSFAKNKEKLGSDVDLILVGTFPVSQVTSDIRKCELKFNREINFTVYSQTEFDKEAKKAGGFLNLVLKDRIVFLKGDVHAKQAY